MSLLKTGILLQNKPFKHPKRVDSDGSLSAKCCDIIKVFAKSVTLQAGNISARHLKYGSIIVLKNIK